MMDFCFAPRFVPPISCSQRDIINSDFKITGFAPLNHSESAGFGKRMEDDFFKEGMVGVSMDGEVKASKTGGENEIVGITGATISTGTILRGINDAVKVLGELK